MGDGHAPGWRRRFRSRDGHDLPPPRS